MNAHFNVECMLSLLKNRIMRKILKYFGFYDNGKTTVTKKQCNINSVSKWVAVSEQLPPEGIKVIVATNDYLQYPDNIFTGVKRGDIFHYADTPRRSNTEFKHITHWTDIPLEPLVL